MSGCGKMWHCTYMIRFESPAENRTELQTKITIVAGMSFIHTPNDSNARGDQKMNYRSNGWQLFFPLSQHQNLKTEVEARGGELTSKLLSQTKLESPCIHVHSKNHVRSAQGKQSMVRRKKKRPAPACSLDLPRS